jgi:hypothetical protein
MKQRFRNNSMNNIKIRTQVENTTTVTRTLELNLGQIEVIVRNWAIKSQGFTAPKVRTDIDVVSSDHPVIFIEEVTTDYN